MGVGSWESDGEDEEIGESDRGDADDPAGNLKVYHYWQT